MENKFQIPGEWTTRFKECDKRRKDGVHSNSNFKRDMKTRKEAKKEIKTMFEDKYKQGTSEKDEKSSHVQFFFKKLRF